jgi:hypothetical protein
MEANQNGITQQMLIIPEKSSFLNKMPRPHARSPSSFAVIVVVGRLFACLHLGSFGAIFYMAHTKNSIRYCCLLPFSPLLGCLLARARREELLIEKESDLPLCWPPRSSRSHRNVFRAEPEMSKFFAHKHGANEK